VVTNAKTAHNRYTYVEDGKCMKSLTAVAARRECNGAAARIARYFVAAVGFGFCRSSCWIAVISKGRQSVLDERSYIVCLESSHRTAFVKI
jgi:hypothetical protein